MRIPSNKISDIMRFAHQELDALYPEREVGAMVRRLVSEYCGLSLTQILCETDARASESELLKIHFAIKELKNYKPLQYILGHTEFLGLDILLSRHVLIPRVETEQMVQMIIEENKTKPNLRIADLCCGSGCIAVALAKHLGGSRVTAIDISREAVEQTKENAQHNGVEIELTQADILNLDTDFEPFDIVVSNPPYVRQSEKSAMSRNVTDFEPELALFVQDENPLVFYKAVASFCEKHLKSGGSLYLEANEALCEQTSLIFTTLDYQSRIVKDLHDKDRMVFCKKNRP